MTENAIGEKERVQILLAEYSSLRAEILARTTSVYQVAAISALAAIWLLQQPFGKRLLVGGILAVVGLSICAWVLARDSMRAALRVQELETEINRRAGEHLLVWDNEWGGMTTPLWGSRIIRSILGLNRPPYSK
jgi:O-antigen ligase